MNRIEEVFDDAIRFLANMKLNRLTEGRIEESAGATQTFV